MGGICITQSKPPAVSVIVTHQLDINAPYLKVCLEALDASRGVEFEVLVMSATEKKPEALKRPNFSYLWSRDLDTAKKKVDMAMSLLSKDSTHVLLLSDDVIVSQTMIASLYGAFGGRDMIMNPMSNSDVGSLYEAELFLDPVPCGEDSVTESVKMRPDMTLEDLHPGHLRQLMRYEREDGKLLMRCPWISFYCTMLTKRVWQHVGSLDEALEYRHSDQDYCMRASQHGIPSVINFGAFAFHFGSRTLRHTHDDVKNQASKHFVSKWTKK